MTTYWFIASGGIALLIGDARRRILLAVMEDKR